MSVVPEVGTALTPDLARRANDLNARTRQFQTRLGVDQRGRDAKGDIVPLTPADLKEAKDLASDSRSLLAEYSVRPKDAACDSTYINVGLVPSVHIRYPRSTDFRDTCIAKEAAEEAARQTEAFAAVKRDIRQKLYIAAGLTVLVTLIVIIVVTSKKHNAP